MQGQRASQSWVRYAEGQAESEVRNPMNPSHSSSTSQGCRVQSWTLYRVEPCCPDTSPFRSGAYMERGKEVSRPWLAPLMAENGCVPQPRWTVLAICICPIVLLGTWDGGELLCWAGQCPGFKTIAWQLVSDYWSNTTCTACHGKVTKLSLFRQGTILPNMLS